MIPNQMAWECQDCSALSPVPDKYVRRAERIEELEGKLEKAEETLQYVAKNIRAHCQWCDGNDVAVKRALAEIRGDG